MLRRGQRSYNLLADLGLDSAVNYKPLFSESVSGIQTYLLETQQRLIKLMPEKEKQISEAAEKLMQILKEESEKL